MYGIAIKEILERINEEAPFSLKENWDNVGLIVGDSRQKISKIGVALNVLPSTVAAAAADGCSLLITHHPPFFSLERICTETPEGKALKIALNNDLAILSLHTNLDRAFGGINGALGKLLSLKESAPLVSQESSPLEGDGLTGILEEPLSMPLLGEKIQKCWNLSWVKGYLSPHKNQDYKFARMALLGGSGSSFWKEALQKKADLFITGDVKYHHRLEALQEGLSLLQVDHGEMEEAALFAIAQTWETSWGRELSFSYIPFQSWEKPAMLLWESC